MTDFKDKVCGEQIQSLFDQAFVEEIAVYKLFISNYPNNPSIPGEVGQESNGAAAALKRIASFLISQQGVGAHMFFSANSVAKLQEEINKVPAIQQFVLSLTSRFLAKIQLYGISQPWFDSMLTLYKNHLTMYTPGNGYLDTPVAASIAAVDIHEQQTFFTKNSYIFVSYMLALLPITLITATIEQKN